MGPLDCYPDDAGGTIRRTSSSEKPIRDRSAMSRLTAALLSRLLVAAAAAAQTPATLDSIDRYVRTEVTRYRIPGLSLAVLRGDSVVLARGYGYANVEHRVPATDSTVYQSGSVGKRSEEHTSELQSRPHLVCRLLLEKKKTTASYKS